MLKVSLEFLEDTGLELDHDVYNWDYESDQHSNYQYNAVPLLNSDDETVGWKVYRQIDDIISEYLSFSNAWESELNRLNIPFTYYT